MIYAIAVAFVAGFVSGWAFFKHRATIAAAAAAKIAQAEADIKAKV